jgi:hypothetical protein
MIKIRDIRKNNTIQVNYQVSKLSTKEKENKMGEIILGLTFL